MWLLDKWIKGGDVAQHHTGKGPSLLQEEEVVQSVWKDCQCIDMPGIDPFSSVGSVLVILCIC